MVVLTFFWMNQPRTYGDETYFVERLSTFREYVFGKPHQVSSNDYLFIDVSESKAVLPLTPDSSRNIIITDRKKLTELFEFLHQNKNKFRFILSDILFDKPSIYDKNLEASIHKLGDKILGVNQLDGKNIIEPVIKIPHASSSVFVEEQTIIKYPFFLNDTLKTIPAAMYEYFEKTEIKSQKPFVSIKNKGFSVGTPIFDLFISEEELQKNTEKDSAFVKLGLGEIVGLIRILKNNEQTSQGFFDQYFKNRIILIGDFENDRHSTVYGTMPGTLILLNAFLTFQSENGIISIWLLLFLILGFGLISYTFFIDNIIRIKGVVLMFVEHNRGFVHFFTYYGLFLTVMMILCYYIFKVHISILFLLVYLKAVDWIFNKKYKLWWEEISKKYKKYKKTMLTILK